MLRERGLHPRTKSGRHDDGCKVAWGQGWGARIRTWDRGTKTRCLTTWLRPTAFEYRNRNDEAPRCAPDGRAGEAGTASKRHRKRRRRTWLRPTAFEYRNRNDEAPRCAPDGRAGEAGPASKRHRKRRPRSWLRPTAVACRTRADRS